MRRLPPSVDPNLLVGLETRDDAGVLRLSENLALVQTVDFFTPIVDDPYSYGQIAAANALSDIYAMGGRPISALNIACFDPHAAPPEVWADVLKGMYDKTLEAGAVVLGGHTVEDDEPKFGMAVTGLIDPSKIFANTDAEPGDGIWLSKPLGTGIVVTAAKRDACSADELQAAIDTMTTLNAAAARAALEAEACCATDITGFGLAGHLFNVARSSNVAIELETALLQVLPGVERMITEGHVTGGGARNRAFLGSALKFGAEVPQWMQSLVVDPQTSGGLAVFSKRETQGSVRIGQAKDGPASILVR